MQTFNFGCSFQAEVLLRLVNFDGSKSHQQWKRVVVGAILSFQWCHRYPHFFPKTSGFRFFLCIIMSQLKINCKVWHTLRFWVICLASVRLKRYKEAFVTFEVLANASANNRVILDVRMSPHGRMNIFADYAFEMSSKGLRREELGGVGKLGL